MAGIFEGVDDYMFPTTTIGKKAAGVYEFDEPNKTPGNDAFFESVTSSGARSQAMAAVLQWLEMGQYDYGTMDEVLSYMADMDGDEEYTEDEEAYYNDIWQETANALLSLGGNLSDVEAFCNGPGKDADNAAQRLGATLSDNMTENGMDDEDIVAGFAYGEDALMESVDEDTALHGIFEATYKKVRAVHDGKVVFKQKRVSGKVKLSAERRAALKEARRKANSAGAKLRRRKSMKIRKQRGL